MTRRMLCRAAPETHGEHEWYWKNTLRYDCPGIPEEPQCDRACAHCRRCMCICEEEELLSGRRDD